ncbi:MAG: acyl-CoA dehydratase activase-related protein [Candidatus Adiutrix sp.]|jgi:predicted CoA-substrate-specific enzyme activase|nr:acyl-CoA dehydratase activase-related protein [Candidatus Adiutrix sp.]
MIVHHTGLDVGSTTIKIVVTDAAGAAQFSLYQRHFSEVRKTIVEVLLAAAEKFQGEATTLAVAGSGGISAAQWIGAEFVQEVVAGAEAIRRYLPNTDVAIELGGEDAKLTFFNSGIDQRMNETCAGGTGAFIDQMASFLRTDPPGLNELAAKAKGVYPIAARCGVFAKTDILPLLNEGAAREDIAASIFQAVVDQTIGGLACGRSIRGQVAFLGGPLFFLPELRKRFITTLKLKDDEAVCPDEAQVYVALGAALTSRKYAPVSFDEWAERARKLAAADMPPEIDPLPPLFEDINALNEFRARHASTRLPRADWPETGGIFVGLDAGSTTTKLVALDNEGRLLHSFYSHNRGNPLKSVLRALTELYEVMPRRLTVYRSGATGYGEGLIRSALGVDVGEVETVAHYKAAAFFEPEVSFIVDIGGQDIKCLSIKNGVIDRLMLNEACSSGCGSFLETFARTLGLDAAAFSQAALTAARPVDLGSRCTVFMNSKVKQAQKEGAPVGDISAGLSYSVVRNALYKVIRISRPEDLGGRVVAQGGAFFNDAVLRAFELSIGREVVRPDIAGLMGAFGMALLAKEHFHDQPGESTLISPETLPGFGVATKNTRCGKCENRCLLTVNRFSDGRLFISGNRCERGASTKSNAADKIDALANRARLGEISAALARIPAIGSLAKSPPAEFNELPNLFKWNLYRLFEVYKPLLPAEARGVVGIPRVLGLYDNYPFWFTFFTHLGFRVELSPPSSKDMFNKALDTIPSQTVCYPAKLVHGHVLELVERRPDFIFLPSMPLDIPAPYATDARYNCPLVGSYGELIRLNMDVINEKGLPFIAPFIDLTAPAKTARALTSELAPFRVRPDDVKAALKAAYAELARHRDDIHSAGERALNYLKKNGGAGVILAGHPYHIDPEVHHGISDVIASNGLAVLTCDSVDHLAPADSKLRMFDQWIPHSRLYRAALVTARRENLELVQLNSFGCGLDAITTDQVREILEDAGKVYTLLKIDEGANLGAARIRIRSLLAAIKERRRSRTANAVTRTYRYEPVKITADKVSEYTILAPQMSPAHWQFLAPAMAPSGYRLEILPKVSREAIEEGLRHVNNDACYPALISIGQLLHALKTGGYDLSRTAVMMSQTGGGCRATNYVGFLRRALEECDMGHVPVWPFSLAQSKSSEGVKVDRAMIKRILLALLYGDLLNRLLLASRPYETAPGEAQKLYDRWSIKAARIVESGDAKAFRKDVRAMVEDFAALNLKPADRPKVGILGEILINFHPEANNHAIEVVEAEGGQAVLPELTDFFMYCLYDDVFRADTLAGSRMRKWVSLWLIHMIERARKPMRKALAKHPRFGCLQTFKELKKAGEGILSLGNQYGEGWYLAADMAMMIEKGIPNILCLQPFGCLPNHITGKGVVKELKRRYPRANLVAVDYDPGTSEVNQLNRIKLMMSVALDAEENQRAPERPQGPPMFPKNGTSSGLTPPSFKNNRPGPTSQQQPDAPLFSAAAAAYVSRKF